MAIFLFLSGDRMANAIYERIKTAVNIDENLEYPSFDKIKKGLYITHQLSGAMLLVYGSLRGTPDEKAELADALKMFYVEYVEPIDLPLGDFMERLFDANVPTAFPALVEVIDATLDKKLGQ
jgi:hypothetical protein